MNDLKEYYDNHLFSIGMPIFENLSEIALIAIRGSIGYQVYKLGGK
jgi:hypothetical protein